MQAAEAFYMKIYISKVLPLWGKKNAILVFGGMIFFFKFNEVYKKTFIF
jgi:hypothetical protein